MIQTGDMADEEQSEPETEVPTTKEAFVTADHVDDGGETKGHIYDGYELLLDIDESVLDDYLPPPAGRFHQSISLFHNYMHILKNI